MKSLATNLWNYNNVMTADKEAQIKYSYQQHQKQLSKLKDCKKPNFDNEAPVLKKKRDLAQSKIVKERKFIIEQENGALIHKMLDVKKKNGEYSKKLLVKSIESSTAPKSLFLPLKIATEKRVNSENIALINRLKNANSTINFKTLNKDFEQSTKYKSNITTKSRISKNNNSHENTENRTKFILEDNNTPNKPNNSKDQGEATKAVDNKQEGEQLDRNENGVSNENKHEYTIEEQIKQNEEIKKEENSAKTGQKEQ